MKIEIKGFKNLNLKYLVLDVNGTISTEGKLIDGVKEKIEILKKEFEIYLLTADTFGKGKEISDFLGIKMHKLEGKDEDIEKLNFIKKLGSENCIAMGNGNNDALMLKESALGISIIGEEGLSSLTLKNSDIIFKDINNALESLIKNKRIVATLRR